MVASCLDTTAHWWEALECGQNGSRESPVGEAEEEAWEKQKEEARQLQTLRPEQRQEGGVCPPQGAEVGRKKDQPADSN